MAYATHSDIAAEFKGFSGFSSSTTPTSTQVTEWCSRASALIDSKISGKYSTPVSSTDSPDSFSVLKEVCVLLVGSKVKQVLNLQTGEAKTSSAPAKQADWMTRANDILKEIQEGTMKLSDAELATSADGVESYTDDNSNDTQPPTFTKLSDNW